jgi:DNA-binding NarL/FixJ family response regulator
LAIRLLIADDQDLIRQGLSTLLSVDPEIEVVGQAANGQEAIDLALSANPDVILMDVEMPVLNGIQAMREIGKKAPNIKILVLTTFDNDEYIADSLVAGAIGYLLKNLPPQQIIAAVKGAANGLAQFSAAITPKLHGPNRKNIHLSSLTERECEVLALLGRGKTNREIATALNITEGTVKNYVSNILQSLGVRDRTQAALWASQNLY